MIYGQKHSTQLSTVQMNLQKLSEKVVTKEDLQKLSEEVITKQDLINLGEELGRHNPCFRNAKSLFQSIFRRYQK